MPILAISRRNDVSAELYAAYRAQAPIDAVPHGALAHVYGQTADGIVSIDVWANAEAMEAYYRDIVIPATEALGVAYERPEIIEATTFLTTADAEKFVVPFLETAEA